MATWMACGVLLMCFSADAGADSISLRRNRTPFSPRDSNNVVIVGLANDLPRQGLQLDLTYDPAIGLPIAVDARGRFRSGVQLHFSTATPGVIHILAYDSSATRASIAAGSDSVFAVTFAIRDTVPDSTLVVVSNEGLTAADDLTPVAIAPETLSVALCPCPPPVPTLILSFTAVPTDDERVRVTWLLSSTEGSPTTNLYRLNQTTGEGTRLNPQPYVGVGPNVYVDSPPSGIGGLTYELTEVGPGRETRLGTVQVGADQRVPLEFALYQSWPNPFSLTTKIRYDVPRSSHIRVAVYDVAGRLVRTLKDEDARPGRYDVSWDGRGTRGQSSGAGIYFYVASMDKRKIVRRMVLIQ
jgi:hypothetical protein